MPKLEPMSESSAAAAAFPERGAPAAPTGGEPAATRTVNGQASATTTAAQIGSPALAASLDRLSSHWRIAFEAAADALDAAGNCGTSLRFDLAELAGLRASLTRERALVSELLADVALDEHVRLHRPLSAPRATPRMLGLPESVRACVFDLDAVLTGSPAIHAAAWAETFDEFLLRRAERTGERFAPFTPFDPSAEYRRHLHGRPRIAGVHAFLASRGIRLSQGTPDDPPDAETVYGLGNRKNLALLHRLDRDGVTAHEDAQRYLEAVHEAGLRCAVVSASATTETMVERAGLATLIDERVDAETYAAQRLAPLPAPDTLLAACKLLDVSPEQTAVFETTIAGVEAGAAAGFALVVAVERWGHAETFRAHGADTWVADLGGLLDPSLAALPARRHLASSGA
jgi:HAD superfamily hydrolase (TIGR01509 family)